MKLLDFALIKITLCLIAGILFAHYTNFPKGHTLLITFSFILSLWAVLKIENKRLVKSLGFSILTFFTFIAIGSLTYQWHDQKDFKHHYAQRKDLKLDSIKTVTFQIREVLKPGTNYEKYRVEILKINNQVHRGKILLNVKKDSVFAAHKVDDILVAAGPLRDLNSKLNPYQFDYKAYLENQYVYHQLFVDHSKLLKVSSEVHTLLGYAAQLRTRINKELKRYNFRPDELALINALLLGQRQDISNDILDSYSKAGAIHILAVSGLHVGIILYLLSSLFKPLEYFRHGRILKTVLIVIFLWSFAVVAGLSASVTRAVTMFSIVAIGINLKRPSNIYNTLAISMFFLLLFKPLFLFDVGFQMSYSAVFAIVSMQPHLVKLWQPKFKPVKKLWEIFTITMAAQIGVMPISLFYFHQFPGLFFVSNLVIIPVLGLILGMGILVILMAVLNILPYWIADLYGSMISMMNSFVRWVALQEKFIFHDISFSILQVLTSYLMIISLFSLYKKPNFRRLTATMVSILILQMVLIFEKQKNQTDELIVFHKSRFSVIGLKTNTSLTVSHNLDSMSVIKDHILRNYKVGNSISSVQEDTLQNLYLFHDKKFLVIDSLGIYRVPELHPEYVILRNSPKINLSRMLDSVRPELIIADGSNFKSYIQRWEATCIKKDVPFHLTSKEGAFVLKND